MKAARKMKLRFPDGRACVIWTGRDLFSPGARGCRIWFEDSVLREPGHAFLIADSRLGSHCARVERALRSRGWKTQVIRLRATELSKDLHALDSVYRRLIEGGADRSSVIFAVGGGVIGDVSGFVAATYMRGLRWVGVPTTLLAQVDSSVGGKTGVNHPLGKNLIGAFHQPSSVICDLSMLGTLPRREVISGLGEIVKYGLLSDTRFFRWIARNWDALARLEEPALEKAVTRCQAIKARIVERDERETRGLRAGLNLGHTVGHALEAATGFTRFRHGEAVIHGLQAMLELSAARGHLDPRLKAEIRDFLSGALSGTMIPSIPPSISAARISALTLRDKKATRGKRRFVLLRGIGKPVIDERVSEAELRRSLRASGFQGRAR